MHNVIQTSISLLQNAAKVMHGEKHTSTHFSHRFSNWFSPLLHYLLVSSINIVDICKTGKQNPLKSIEGISKVCSGYLYFQVLISLAWELADNANRCIRQNTYTLYICDVTHMVQKATEEKRKTRRPGVLT